MNWAVFSRETKYGKIIAKTPELKIIETQMRLLQKEASDHDKYNSNQRSGLRKKQDKAHEQQKRIVRDLTSEILQDFYDKNGAFGLGIDSVRTGQKNGSFAHEKFQKEMAFWMTREGLPFYHVATPYTSRRCPECGTVCAYNSAMDNYTNKEKTARNHKTNRYTCHNKDCDVSTEEGALHGDMVGALNNEAYCEWLQDASYEMVNTTSRSYNINQWRILKAILEPDFYYG
jgi:hypothetical protein